MINEAEMTPRQKEIVAKIVNGPRGGIRGPFIALIHHPELANVFQQVGEQLRFNATISQRLVELAILLVARYWTCHYEWIVHERMARDAELSDSVICAIRLCEIPVDLSDDERVVYDFMTRTLKVGAPTNEVYDEAYAKFGRQGVLDLIGICGYYSTLAMLLNTSQIPLPEGCVMPLRER